MRGNQCQIRKEHHKHCLENGQGEQLGPQLGFVAVAVVVVHSCNG